MEVMHHLFLLEHNHVCDKLRKAYSTWSEEDFYETSRLVIAAVIAKIHTVDWTPMLLQNPALNISMHNNW